MPSSPGAALRSLPVFPVDDIDEYGDLELQVLQLALVAARLKALKEKFQKYGQELPGDMPGVLRGKRWTIQFTPRENERIVTNAAKAWKLLTKILGVKGAIAVIKIPLGEAIDKHIPASLHPEFLVQERTGSRSLKAVLNEVPVAKKAA